MLRATEAAALFTPFGHGNRQADLLGLREETRGGARREGRAAGEDDVLCWGIMAGQLSALDAELLDRHAPMGRDAISELLPRPLREADGDIERAGSANRPWASSDGNSGATLSLPITQAALLA